MVNRTEALPGLGGEAAGRVRLAKEMFKRHCFEPERFLDIGCSNGVITRWLADELNAGTVFGVDITDSALEKAKGRGILASGVDLNVERLPFEDGSIDAIFCSEVIEHLVNTDHLLDEVRRVLSPTGVCVLSTPNLASWVNRIALIFGWQPFFTDVSDWHSLGRPRWVTVPNDTPSGYGGHLRVFTAGALSQLVEAHHLRVIERRAYSLSDSMANHQIKAGSVFRNVLLKAAFQLDRLLTHRHTLGAGTIITIQRA